jgi:hypothetical protein
MMWVMVNSWDWLAKQTGDEKGVGGVGKLDQGRLSSHRGKSSVLGAALESVR